MAGRKGKVNVIASARADLRKVMGGGRHTYDASSIRGDTPAPRVPRSEVPDARGSAVFSKHLRQYPGPQARLPSKVSVPSRADLSSRGVPELPSEPGKARRFR